MMPKEQVVKSFNRQTGRSTRKVLEIVNQLSLNFNKSTSKKVLFVTMNTNMIDNYDRKIRGVIDTLGCKQIMGNKTGAHCYENIRFVTMQKYEEMEVYEKWTEQYRVIFDHEY